MSKTIITIRHTESEHHKNNCSGGVSFWNLTETGKKQAFKIGEWLSENENLKGYKMPHAENDTELWNRMKNFYESLLQSDENGNSQIEYLNKNVI